MADIPPIELSRYCIPFTPFHGRLEDAALALVSTAGVHHKDDRPFRTDGDTTFRIIPGDAAAADLRVADEHYDHACVDLDVNCVFPIDRVVELVRERRLGAVAPRHFSLGYSQALRQIKSETVPRLVNELLRDRPDVVLLTGG